MTVSQNDLRKHIYQLQEDFISLCFSLVAWLLNGLTGGTKPNNTHPFIHGSLTASDSAAGKIRQAHDKGLSCLSQSMFAREFMQNYSAVCWNLRPPLLTSKLRNLWLTPAKSTGNVFAEQ